MRRARLSFLPLFFTVLGLLFAAALVWRAWSYAPRQKTDIREGVSTSSAAQPGPESPATMAGTEAPAAGARPTAARTSIARGDSGSAQSDRTDTAIAPQAGATAEHPPSFLSRLVAPIVNAVAGNSTSKAAPAQPSTSAQKPSQTSSTSQSQSSGSDHSHGSDRASTAEKDPSSDTQPPQLLAIGFNPPQIRDGEETQVFVQATDDLSGIRSISGTVVGPSGAAQGFACQREGETDRYVARVAVPKDAADGVWRVNYLNLIDYASNAATLSGAQVPPSATFRVVSSAPDAAGPSLRAVSLERQAMRAGEKNNVFVDAEDDKSGLSLISGVFISPARHARIGFVCRPADGPWQCEFGPPDCIDCGDWHLEQIQMQDKANNMTTVRGDNPIVQRVVLNITGDRCDSSPPALQGVTLDRNAVANAEESVITVTAFASDDTCGMMSISGQVTGPTTAGSAPRLYFSFGSGGDSPSWTGRIIVPRLAAKGTWRITWIQALDRAHNLKTYTTGDPVLVNAVFNVQ